MKILFVCLGNICRSPLAEDILKKKIEALGLNWEVDSAGTNGFHNGEAPHKFSQKVAARNGIDISKQRSRQIKKADLMYYDLIYAFASDVMRDMKHIAGDSFKEQSCKYFLLPSSEDGETDVLDPWYGGEDGFTEVYKVINDGCDKIIDTVLK